MYSQSSMCTTRCCLYLHVALANLRAALVALTSATANPQAAGGGVVLPGCVVLVSNLNEKV